jgi:phenylacetate-CoA ligase
MSTMRRLLTVTLLRLGRRERWRHLQAMKAYQWQDRQSLQHIHDQRLAAILRYAITNVPRYRELATQRGWQVESLCHARLCDFPLVDKAILSSDQSAYLALDAINEDRYETVTGGSTGVKFKFVSDRRARQERQACDLLGRIWTGWRIGEPQATVWGHPGDVKDTETPRARLQNALLYRSITLNALQMEDAVLRSFIQRLMIHRPRFILGYASALAFLAQTMQDQGIKGLRPCGIISAAEYLSDDQRTVIENHFGCKVLNRYGSREFGTVAQQCEQIGGFHIFTNRAHVELLHPDGSPCLPGERGEITVTDLTNRVMPFIRYRTGDLAVATDEMCPCGRQYPLIASVEGRVSELIVGLNGRTIACPGPTFWIKDIPGVHQLQIYQPDRESIEARVVPDARWSEEAARLLTARCHELLGPMRVSIVLRDEIPVSPSGKYRFAISEVSPFNRPGVSGPSH